MGTREPRTRRVIGRHPGTWWVGLALFLVGIGVLVWVAWGVWGTNWISGRAERREIALFKGNQTKVNGGERDVSGPPALLEIPRFGANYVVPINDGTTPDILAEGVAHFLGTGPARDGKPTSIEPGAVGNYALAGHRITHGQPFANLPDLRPGDRIYVITHHTTYVYVLDTNPNELVVPFTAGWVLGPDPSNPRGGPQAVQAPNAHVMTLATCSELFHTDNRMIAFGHLISTYPTDSTDPTRLLR